jgi:Bacterial protein of unknown function (DUF899)
MTTSRAREHPSSTTRCIRWLPRGDGCRRRGWCRRTTSSRSEAPTATRPTCGVSEMFAPGKDPLVIYSMMFPRDPGDERPGAPGGRTALLPLVEGPCPSCTACSISSMARPSTSASTLAAVGKAPLSRILTFAERGWRRLRLLSSAGSTYNRDYFAETAEGHQRLMSTVPRPHGHATWSHGQGPRQVGRAAGILNPPGAARSWSGQFAAPIEGYIPDRTYAARCDVLTVVAVRRNRGQCNPSAGAAGGRVVLVDCAARDGVPAAGRTGDLDPAGLYLR